MLALAPALPPQAGAQGQAAVRAAAAARPALPPAGVGPAERGVLARHRPQQASSWAQQDHALCCQKRGACEPAPACKPSPPLWPRRCAGARCRPVRRLPWPWRPRRLPSCPCFARSVLQPAGGHAGGVRAGPQGRHCGGEGKLAGAGRCIVGTALVLCVRGLPASFCRGHAEAVLRGSTEGPSASWPAAHCSVSHSLLPRATPQQEHAC